MAVTVFACVCLPLKGSSVAKLSDPPFRFGDDFHVFRNAKVPLRTLSVVHRTQKMRCSSLENSRRNPTPDEQEEDQGVKVALSLLKFYKREISPLLPASCRYVPTCSEYSMEAYKRYGVVKGTVLTAWRLCRCNPLGGSGFDPPRWFGENRRPLE